MAWQVDTALGWSDIKQMSLSSGLVMKQQVLCPQFFLHVIQKSAPDLMVGFAAKAAQQGPGWVSLWQEMPGKEQGAAGSVEGDSVGGVLPSRRNSSLGVTPGTGSPIWALLHSVGKAVPFAACGPGSSPADGIWKGSLLYFQCY